MRKGEWEKEGKSQPQFIQALFSKFDPLLEKLIKTVEAG